MPADYPSHAALAAIERWLIVREREGCPVEPDCFTIEAEHSIRGGLLGYILGGGEPHEHPPPRAYSRPWYALIDEGGYEGPLGGHDGPARLGAWRITRTGEPDGLRTRWHLRPHAAEASDAG